jgi:hypothetical protein
MEGVVEEKAELVISPRQDLGADERLVLSRFSFTLTTSARAETQAGMKENPPEAPAAPSDHRDRTDHRADQGTRQVPLVHSWSRPLGRAADR